MSIGKEMKSQPIKVHDLCKSFHKRYVLENISFEIMPKTFFTLVGKSGCGKTTLLNCIGLIEPFDCGSVNFGTLDVTKPSTKLRRN